MLITNFLCLQTREMAYDDFFAELDTCVPDSRFYPLNVIDIRTRPKSIYTVPQMISRNSINHLTDELIQQSMDEPYSCSTSYYTLVTQGSAHTTWHQDYSATSVFYLVRAGEKIFFLAKKNLTIFGKWPNAESDIM